MHVVAPGSEVGERIGQPTQYTDTDTNDTASASTSTSKVTNGTTSFKPVNNGMSNGSSANTTMGGALNVAHTHPISSLSPYHNKYVIIFIL